MQKLKSIFIKDLTPIEHWDLLILCFAIGGMLYSSFVFSISLSLLGIRAFFSGDFKSKIQKFKDNKFIVLALLSLFFLHILGLCWTTDLSEGIKEINHKLPLLIIPLAILFISPMKKSMLRRLILIYILLLLIGSLIAMFHYIIDPNADERRLIYGLNTISFGINIAFAVSLILIYAYKNYNNPNRSSKIKIVSLILTSVWFVIFLCIIKAMTGLVILFILAVYLSIKMFAKGKSKVNYSIAVLLLMGLVICIFAVRTYYKEYFTPKPFSQSLKTTTALGNQYTHLDDGFIENGYYVNQYVCETEMTDAFEKRTGIKVSPICDTNPNVVCAERVKRYLNSMGLTKDAAGVNALSKKDIDNIKNGYENIVYTKRLSIKPRIYKTFFELERYFGEGKFDNGSISQRIELSLNAIDIISNNLLIGAGTGDNIKQMDDAVRKRNDKASFDNIDPHNYYLYIMVQFGILGLLILIFFLIYPATKAKIWANPVWQTLFIIIVAAMFVESTLNRVSMVAFFCLTYTILLFNKPISDIESMNR
ncbi:MAG: O-antigen ligase family protein [Bacteroidales bacterium]|jgi:O-antigen ligase|nr:O-antigen ligase family protein [Bacteroidales bacterium]